MNFVKRQLMGDDNFVTFEPIEHAYTTKDGQRLISVSQLIKKFSPEFDPDGSILRRKAAELGVSPEELKKEWDKKKDDSCVFGTNFHKSAEHFIETGKILKDDNQKLVKALKKKVKFAGNVFSEQLLYNLNFGIAGTTDVVEYFEEDNSISLKDFKTNGWASGKPLEKFSIFKNRMLPPLSNKFCTQFYKYCLQLSLYGWMLEEKGYWVKDLTLLHIRRDDIEIHPVPYLRNDVITILNHHKGIVPPKKPYSPWITV